MALGFERERSFSSSLHGKLERGSLDLSAYESERYSRIRKCWDFYEGYHWEDLPPAEGAEVTVNLCKAFVDKYVSFELGEGFKFNMHPKVADLKVTPEGKNTYEFLESVWKDNHREELSTEIGQMKSITGESWVHVHFMPPGTFHDPFNIYTDGRIVLDLLPSSACFPSWNPHRRGQLDSFKITYAYDKVITNPITFRREERRAVYSQIWTNDNIVVRDDGEERIYANKYGTIPIIYIRNSIFAGRDEGRSDLEDLIPLNLMYNMKNSDISEIIDYHAAPITIVTGAKIGNLEKGANKVWGGLPKGATVQNLGLNSDLGSAVNYAAQLKKDMCIVGNMPESAIGGAEHISNTSGIALHIANGPLVEYTKNKRRATQHGLEELNRMILYVSLFEGLIKRGSVEEITNEEFFYNEVKIPDTMPKDEMIALQQLKLEMQMGMESRKGAMERMNRENIDEKIQEVDSDRKEHPDLYDLEDTPDVNSGLMNGSNPQEIVNKEINGQNVQTADSTVE